MFSDICSHCFNDLKQEFCGHLVGIYLFNIDYTISVLQCCIYFNNRIFFCSLC